MRKPLSTNHQRGTRAPRFNIRIGRDLYCELEAQAHAQGQTLSERVRSIIEHGIAAEKAAAAAEAERREIAFASGQRFIK
jgi:predicted DNA-binding protein